MCWSHPPDDEGNRHKQQEHLRLGQELEGGHALNAVVAGFPRDFTRRPTGYALRARAFPARMTAMASARCPPCSAPPRSSSPSACPGLLQTSSSRSRTPRARAPPVPGLRAPPRADGTARRPELLSNSLPHPLSCRSRWKSGFWCRSLLRSLLPLIVNCRLFFFSRYRDDDSCCDSGSHQQGLKTQGKDGYGTNQQAGQVAVCP